MQSQQNHTTYMVKEHHQYCGSGSEASFRFFVEKPLYAIYFTRIKEQVDERKNTVGIHKNTDCFLKNIPLNIRNMLTLSIKNSEDVLVGSDFLKNLLLFFTNHYLSLPNQGTFCIYIYICK